MPILIRKFVSFLQKFAPLELAEEWDNVGLLVGDEDATIDRVMTCLTLTPDVAQEAIEHQVGLVVSHHPIMFRPVKTLTSRTTEGQMLLDLIGHQVAVYSPHTAFDSALLGINQSLAEQFGLLSIKPIREIDDPKLPNGSGSGRYGKLKRATTLEKFLDRVRKVLNVTNLQYVGELDSRIATVGVACGSAAEYLRDAHRLGCDLLVTGEGRFHACLESRALGIPMILAGHFATERPAVESLAEIIAQQFPELETWASEVETDPLEWSLG